MKRIYITHFLGLGLAVLLTACGGDNVQIDTPRTAAMLQNGVAAGGSDHGASTTPAAYPAVVTQVASATMPQPDCAQDGCKGLRIIDGNAEAFRYQAMQRAANPQL